jgi:hypothetical protein
MPQVFQVRQIAQPIYYDRQPTGYNLLYSATVGPHVKVTRATYSPLPGAVAYIEAVWAVLLRSTVAAATVLASVDGQHIANDTGPTNLVQIILANAAANALESGGATSLGAMKNLDTFNINTQNFDTGGTISMSGYAKISEYRP